MSNRKTTVFNLLFLILTVPALSTLTIFIVSQIREKREVVSFEEFHTFYANKIEKRILLPASFIVHRYLMGGKKFGNVHFGKDGWLFYLPKADGKSLFDLLGIDLQYSAINSYWGRRFSFYSRLFSKKKIPWGVIFTPNKSRIYSDYLRLIAPARVQDGRFPVSFQSLEKVLHSIDPQAAYVSPRDIVLIRNRESRLLYDKTDTHWNVLGARYAYNLISGQMSLPPLPLRPATDLSRFRTGDIIRMLNAPRFLSSSFDERKMTIESSASCHKKELEATLEIHSCANSISNKTILVVGDSFRHNFAIANREAFKTTIVIHVSDFSESVFRSLSERYDIDYAIVVRVERYIRR